MYRRRRVVRVVRRVQPRPRPWTGCGVVLEMAPSRAVLVLSGVSLGIAFNLVTNRDRDVNGFVRGLGLGRAYTHLGGLFRRILDPERSHVLSVRGLGFSQRARRWLGLVSTASIPAPLATSVLGLKLSSPVGLAAGFDKDAKCVEGALDLGFGFVEVGSVTPVAQAGQARPRVFRLEDDKAVINRYGFNSEGISVVAGRLERLRAKSDSSTRTNSGADCPLVIGVNLGRNKTSKNFVDIVGDYCRGVERLAPLADYLVINVSCPNTPGGSGLQKEENLQRLLSAVIATRNRVSKKTPVLLKLSPNLSDVGKREVAKVVTVSRQDVDGGVDGLIVSNTLPVPPCDLPLKSESHSNERGGLSGEPIRDLSTRMIGDMFRLTHGRLPIIGVGGISTGQDAYAKIRAGASLVQLYTALVYQGPEVVDKVHAELTLLLERDGFRSVSDAVGVDSV